MNTVDEEWKHFICSQQSNSSNHSIFHFQSNLTLSSSKKKDINMDDKKVQLKESRETRENKGNHEYHSVNRNIKLKKVHEVEENMEDIMNQFNQMNIDISKSNSNSNSNFKKIEKIGEKMIEKNTQNRKSSATSQWMNSESNQNKNKYEKQGETEKERDTTDKNEKDKTEYFMESQMEGEGEEEEKEEIPLCEDLYISTKTKVVFLNKEIDIQNIFWNIPIIEYWRPCEGVIKKQMKIVSKNVEEFNQYQEHLKTIPYYTENIIKQIDNRGKFKDERKITVGLSKKDIMNCRGKVKNAFYNCFAMIIRFLYEESYREIHIKVFNTGKMEIPGIFNTELLEIIKKMILNVIQPFVSEPLYFVENNADDNVLINSNFNCGFYVNREKTYSILKKKYGIETSYDPCSYPGVKCKFYFNNEKGFHEKQTGKIMEEDCSMKVSELGEMKKYTEVSFMIFRTGSCLIVGNCSEQILMYIFEFVKNILKNEYTEICVTSEQTITKQKTPKLRKKTVTVSKNYLQFITSK